MLSTKFQVSWPFGSGEEAKIDFQDNRYGGHFGFWIGKILLTFDLQVTAPSFKSIGLWVQDGGNLGFWIGTILSIFDLQVI